MGPLFLILAPLLSTVVCLVQAEVSNEDIRLAILQIVKVVRATDDKLERHEYRDRVLGEQLKKGMINIDKRIKSLDPLKGTLSRLDERVAAIETILMQREEKERNQLQKTYDIVVDIQRNLPTIIDSLKNDIIEKISSNEPPAQISEPTMSKKDIERIEKEVLTRMDQVIGSVNGLEKELASIKDESYSIMDLSNKSTENLEILKKQLNSNEQLLAKFDNKLTEYNNKIPEVQLHPVVNSDSNKEQDNWRDTFLLALENQKSQAQTISNTLQNLQSEVLNLPKRVEIEANQNDTINKIEQIRIETLQIPEQSSKLIEGPLREIQVSNDIKQENARESINLLTNITTTLAESFEKNYGILKMEIQALGKIEQVIMQTADNVMDTKRKVEFSRHDILSEVVKNIKNGAKDINQAINDRFDTFEFSILDEETGALTNLTSTIGKEIDQVWRQIGIMHNQMTASTDTLNKLQNQTDAYVNGSLDVMGNMKGKVGEITGRMKEVDENLNYLLGHLSLVTQEFNQIKKGLGNALDEIRNSFHAVQENINKGPGPHNITSNEVLEEK